MKIESYQTSILSLCQAKGHADRQKEAALIHFSSWLLSKPLGAAVRSLVNQGNRVWLKFLLYGCITVKKSYSESSNDFFFPYQTGRI